MKLTKSHLKHVIKEELRKVLNEYDPLGLFTDDDGGKTTVEPHGDIIARASANAKKQRTKRRLAVASDPATGSERRAEEMQRLARDVHHQIKDLGNDASVFLKFLYARLGKKLSPPSEPGRFVTR